MKTSQEVKLSAGHQNCMRQLGARLVHAKCSITEEIKVAVAAKGGRKLEWNMVHTLEMKPPLGVLSRRTDRTMSSGPPQLDLSGERREFNQLLKSLEDITEVYI